MKKNSKGSKILRFCDRYHDGFSLDGFVLFEDNWIGEENKVLYNQDGIAFNVLEFQEIEKNMLVMPEVMPYIDGWRMCKLSCVKLDKEVQLSDIFYCYE